MSARKSGMETQMKKLDLTVFVLVFLGSGCAIITGDAPIITRDNVGRKHVGGISDADIQKIFDMHPEKKALTSNDLIFGQRNLASSQVKWK
jgi:hypothetical protein